MKKIKDSHYFWKFQIIGGYLKRGVHGFIFLLAKLDKKHPYGFWNAYIQKRAHPILVWRQNHPKKTRFFPLHESIRATYPVIEAGTNWLTLRKEERRMDKFPLRALAINKIIQGHCYY